MELFPLVGWVRVSDRGGVSGRVRAGFGVRR